MDRTEIDAGRAPAPSAAARLLDELIPPHAGFVCVTRRAAHLLTEQGDASIDELHMARAIGVAAVEYFGDFDEPKEYQRFLADPWNDREAVQAALAAIKTVKAIAGRLAELDAAATLREMHRYLIERDNRLIHQDGSARDTIEGCEKALRDLWLMICRALGEPDGDGSPIPPKEDK